MPEFQSRELRTDDLKPRISNAALLKTDLNKYSATQRSFSNCIGDDIRNQLL